MAEHGAHWLPTRRPTGLRVSLGKSARSYDDVSELAVVYGYAPDGMLAHGSTDVLNLWCSPKHTVTIDDAEARGEVSGHDRGDQRLCPAPRPRVSKTALTAMP